MTPIGIEDVLYEPVPLVGWKPFNRFHELSVFAPADRLHLHSVIAVWVLNGSRCIGDILRQFVWNK